jgi:hypothetical protein
MKLFQDDKRMNKRENKEIGKKGSQLASSNGREEVFFPFLFL